MPDIVTSEDIHRRAADGESRLYVPQEAIITDIARETARRMSVEIVVGEPDSPRPESDSFGERQDGVLRLSEAPAESPPKRDSSSADGVVQKVDRSPFSPQELRNLRAEFPSLQSTVHLANCSQGAQSLRVRRAVEQYMENWRASGMDWDYWVQEVNNAKGEFARLIGAEPDEVAVVGSVSEAVSSVAGAIDYEGERNRILLTEAEFPTVGHVWLAHEKYGAEVDFVPLRDGELLLEDYRRMMDERTAMAAITHVYYQTGYKQDLEAVAEVIHNQGGYVLVDAYQSCGACEIDVKELDIDILTTGNLKYLLGVPGIAFIYVRPELVPELEPADTGWFAQRDPFSFEVKVLDYAETARRLEGGTPPVTAAFAAQAGMQLLQEVGLDRIEQHIDYLSGYCLRGALTRGLQVASPLEVAKKGPTTAVQVPAEESHAIEMALKRRGVVTSARGSMIRIAPHYFNSEADIDIALDELRRLLG